MKKLLSILLALSLLPVTGLAEGEPAENDLADLLTLLNEMNEHYYLYTTTEQPLEQKYTAPGALKVEYAEFTAEDSAAGKFEVWYPAGLAQGEKAYPLVVIANGTGTPASSYQSFFRHLASWGFIVIGNEDENSRTGASSEESLAFMLHQNENTHSVLYGKVDIEHIGIGGHSQGGVGAINAVTSQAHGNLYTALYTVSGTSPYWGQKDVFGLDWSYDLAKVTIPTFLAAGTGSFDAGTAEDITAAEGQGICPLWALKMNYDALPSGIIKVIARKVNVDHGDTYRAFDGYMTAWFLWHLHGDEAAAAVFVGENAELLHNSLYQDVAMAKCDFISH